jgi:hypothetical protein
MATLTRTTRLVAIAAAILALTAPAAQARFLETASGTTPAAQQLPPDRVDLVGTTSQRVVRSERLAHIPPPAPVATGSDGFDWTGASIGAALATVLVGLGITGAMRLGNRRAAHA